jgi:hypothetical protein
MTRRKRIFKWLLGAGLLLLVLLACFITAILNPGLFYRYKTTVGIHQVYSDHPVDPSFRGRLQQATALTGQSILRDTSFRMDICLDGRTYPAIMQQLFGDAFAWGFYNKVVIHGEINSAANRHESGWNLVQLLAHEMSHCLQFNRYGLFKSNPVAGYPFWKWEGFPEYVARQAPGAADLRANIDWVQTSVDPGDHWILNGDGSRTSRAYYKNWLLVQYAVDVRNMNYDQLLRDTTSEASWKAQMMSWFEGNEE